MTPDWNELFEATGTNLRWRVRLSNRTCIGAEPRCVNSAGYLTVGVHGKVYLVHRILWEMRHGPVPEGMEIDHKDGDRLNNARDNLRLASRAEQVCNTTLRSDSSTGHKGVSWIPSRKKYQAQVQLAGKRMKSMHATLEAAVAAATQYRTQLHGEYAKHQ